MKQLTFGELKRGDKFIFLPDLEDPSEEGYYVFIKGIHESQGIATNAIRLFDGIENDYPEDMEVITVII